MRLIVRANPPEQIPGSERGQSFYVALGSARSAPGDGVRFLDAFSWGDLPSLISSGEAPAQTDIELLDKFMCSGLQHN